MMVGGYPIYVFVPLVAALACGLLFVRQMTALANALGLDPKDAESGKHVGAAILGGEQQLHDKGVHRIVWTLRLAFLVDVICVLLFAYLLFSVTEAV
jgi:hypothetical protein